MKEIEDTFKCIYKRNSSFLRPSAKKERKGKYHSLTDWLIMKSSCIPCWVFTVTVTLRIFLSCQGWQSGPSWACKIVQRSGQPTAVLLTRLGFYRFRLVPFLTELRAVMDWVWTDTTLSLSSWICVEDIYAHIFILKCWRESEKVSQ